MQNSIQKFKLHYMTLDMQNFISASSIISIGLSRLQMISRSSYKFAKQFIGLFPNIYNVWLYWTSGVI